MLDAEIIGMEKQADLALLKVEAEQPAGAFASISDHPPQPGQTRLRDRQPERSAELRDDGGHQLGLAVTRSR